MILHIITLENLMKPNKNRYLQGDLIKFLINISFFTWHYKCLTNFVFY